jgi:hypothetical protein
MNDVCYETVFSCTNALAQTALAYRKTLERLEAVLKQARDALDDSLQYTDEACIHEALAAIDKAIGGKEDA